MFTKFAKNQNASDLFAEEMAKRLEHKVAYNPVEEEYLDPEAASTDPAAKETRHFHGAHGEGYEDEVWGLDLDEEDASGMSEFEVGDNTEKLQKLLDSVKDFDDDQFDAVMKLIDEVADESVPTMRDEGEDEALLDLGDLPLSTSSKKQADVLDNILRTYAQDNVAVRTELQRLHQFISGMSGISEGDLRSLKVILKRLSDLALYKAPSAEWQKTQGQ